MNQPYAQTPVTFDVSLGSLPVPAGWLIGPRSFLVDRIQPDLERIWLPQTATGGGTFKIRRGVFDFAAPKHGLKARLKPHRSVSVPPEDGWLLDLRIESPENWAHFLNIHLALLAAVCRACDLSWRDVRVILPEGTPSYIRAVTDMCGLACLYANATVSGQGVQFEITDWNVLRGERHTLLTNPDLSPIMAAVQVGLPDVSEGLPKRVFLSRKGDRALGNEAEIEALLSARGFVKIYPETLCVADQIEMLRAAEAVVAVHGAGMAPLLYRGADTPELALVELFPVGHITNVYRAVTAALSGRWCGVRGKLEAVHLPEIYRLNQSYLKHSLRNFDVDPASVEAALEQIGVA